MKGLKPTDIRPVFSGNLCPRWRPIFRNRGVLGDFPSQNELNDFAQPLG